MHVAKLKHFAFQSVSTILSQANYRLLQKSSFYCWTYGSNDTGVQKLNPIAVRIFDINRSVSVSEHFYSMCLNDVENTGKAYKIFDKIDSIFQSDGIPSQNCASLSVGKKH